MLHEKPMEIPEIVVQVASYLERKDLVRCVRVSKNWRDIFLPRLWQVVRVFQGPYSQSSPNPEDLYPHRHLIHSLSLHNGLFGLGTFAYLKLRNLEIRYIHHRRENSDVTVSIDLAKTCPLLAHLELTETNMTSTAWMALSEHPHIKSLRLRTVQIEAVDAPWFWKVCQRLENLVMSEVALQGPISEDLVFDQIRRLDMSHNSMVDDEAQMDLVVRSPKLEFLEWNINDYNFRGARTLIRHPIQSNHWPNLNELHINRKLQDADMASILRGAGNGQGRIVKFESRYCEIGGQASKLFGTHFSTLVVVGIGMCKTSSSMVLDILCGCPKLEVLHARNVFAKDIAERGPWVCQQLRDLMICFRVGESEEDLRLRQQQLIFQRLSTLIRLEKLVMWVPGPNDSDESVLEFRLDCGLGQLASLKELANVNFSSWFRGCGGDYVPQLGMEEVAWMAGHWKKLKMIHGRLNSDLQMESQLVITIGSLGIRYECFDIASFLTQSTRQLGATGAEQVMLHERPVEIPEVAGQVASYLCRNDLAKCIRVSRAWRDMFLPRLWRVIHVSEGHFNQSGPNPEDLYPYRHLIHSLSLDCELHGLGTFIYPSLSTLKIWYFQQNKKSVPADFTKTCPALVNLELFQSNMTSTAWMALSEHPHIKSLLLEEVQVEAIAAPWFWKVCERLDNLSITKVALQEPIPEDMVFCRLRRLRMSFNSRVDEEVQMDLAIRSPKLKSLEWEVNNIESLETRTLIRRPIQSNHWPYLDKVNISLNLRDAEVASFLRAVGNGPGNIADTTLKRCELGTQASRALSHHFNTLVTADISCCDPTIRSMVPDILCGCPNLKVLRAGNVFAKDIAERGPWVCQQLRDLMICFRLEESEEDLQLQQQQQQVVFQRLSTLVRLEKLRMCKPFLDKSDESVLEFRLDCGLGQLSNLEELTTIAFSRNAFGGDYIPQLEMEEITWMACNWKKLETIGGCLNSDLQMESQLATSIGSLGIQYTSELYR